MARREAVDFTHESIVKALLLDDLPSDTEARKAERSTTRVAGMNVFSAALVPALLRHGTYDEYYVVHRYRSDPRIVLDALGPLAARVRIVSPAQVGSMKSIERLVLMTVGSDLHDLAVLRAACGRPDWPVVGYIYSVHTAWTAAILPQMIVAGSGTQDALICPTLAGRQVIANLMRWLGQTLFGSETALESPQLPVVPYGIDVDAYSGSRREARDHFGIEPERPVILYLGRMSPLSKCDLGPLMVAFAQEFAGEASQPLLLLAGDDTEHRMAPALRRCATQLGCGDAIVVKPDVTRAEKRQLLAAADLFVSPSDNVQETSGLTVVEAMSAGLPVIASDWNGYRELIRHGVTGFLVPTYWADLGPEIDLLGRITGALASTTIVEIGALRHCLRSLVDNHELRRTMGREARDDARRRFDWTVIIPQYEQICDVLLEAAVARRTDPVKAGRRRPYSAYEMFGHYPTSRLNDSRTLRVSAWGRSWMERQMPLAVLASEAEAYNSAIFQELTDGVLRLGSARVGDLLENVCGADVFAQRAHVARLVKWGVLELGPDEANSATPA